MEVSIVYGGPRTTKQAHLSNEAKDAFSKFIHAKTLTDAVASLLPVLGNRVVEPRQAHAGIWNGTFEFDGISFSEGEEKNYERLLKAIKPGQTASVIVGEDVIIVTHVPERGDFGGGTKPHLHFVKCIKL